MWRLFLGDFVRLHILFQAAKGPISVAEIVATLNRHDYRLSQGKVDAVLRSLEKTGCLTAASVVMSGNRERQFKATSKGRKILGVAKSKLNALASDVL
jgi:DNA-binding PadR family transcriptional regulator